MKFKCDSVNSHAFTETVKDTFKRFGPLAVDWPYKDDTNSIIPPKGFAFLIFEVNDGMPTIGYLQMVSNMFSTPNRSKLPSFFF